MTYEQSASEQAAIKWGELMEEAHELLYDLSQINMELDLGRNESTPEEWAALLAEQEAVLDRLDEIEAEMKGLEAV